ncbi:MAG: hypothetical protein WBK28_03675, partial [Minisyncoccia bacterium]
MNVLPLLEKSGLIKQGDIALIEARARKEGISIEAALVKQGIALDDILRIEGEHYRLPVRTLPPGPVGHAGLEHIPEESARHYKIAPVGLEGGALEVGIIDPENIEALDALQFISTRVGLPYKLFIISETDFNRVLDEYKNLTGEVGEALSEFETSLDD